MEIEKIVCSASDISLPVRQRNTHKSNYGKVLILGGSVGYTGAVSLCARACLRSGAGLTYVGVPEEIYPIIASKLDEAMPFPINRPMYYRDVEQKLRDCTVCVVGPGLGRSDDALRLARDVITKGGKLTVVDADGLYAVKDDPDLLGQGEGLKIITPHAGEFQRMGGRLTGDPGADAAQFARDHGCVVVLKGPETAIAFPEGKVYLSLGGNPGMATGGSGDVLAGILGGLAGQLPVEQAVVAAACIHDACGDLCARRLGEYSMLPSDLISAMPEIMKPMIGR